MGRLLVTAGAGLVLALCAPAQQVDERVSVSVEAAPPRPVVGQDVRVVIRVDVVDAFLEDQVIQPFRQPLDVPIQVLAPWWSGDGRIRPLPAEAKDGVRIAVDGQAVRAAALGVSERGGVRVASFVVERLFRAEAVGEVEIAPTTVRLAYATRWRDDFLAGRVPEDRLDLDVSAVAARIEVRPLPDRDRPADFTGAVGRFAVAAEAAPRAVEVGETLRWTWTVRGDGNLDAFRAPSAPLLDGFHVLGRLEERQADARVFVFELVALQPGTRSLPEVAFGFFDPESGEEGAFAEARAPGLPITVTGDAGPSEVGRVAGAADVGDEPTVTEPAAPTRPHPLRSAADESRRAMSSQAWLVLLVGAWLVAGMAWSGRVAAAVLRRRRDRLAVKFEAGLRQRRDPRELLVELVAAGMSWRPAAVLRPDLAARLVADAGMDHSLAEQLATFLDACTGARHGGPDADVDAATLRALGLGVAACLERRRTEA
jgi:hypothetical protein